MVFSTTDGFKNKMPVLRFYLMAHYDRREVSLVHMPKLMSISIANQWYAAAHDTVNAKQVM